MLKHNEEAGLDVLSLFFVADKSRERIIEIVCVETHALLDHVQLSDDDAAMLIDLNARVPHSLNAQASLTISDLRRLKLFAVP